MASGKESEESNNEKLTLDELFQCLNKSTEERISEGVSGLKRDSGNSLKEEINLVEILHQLGKTYPEAVRKEYERVKNDLDSIMTKITNQYWSWSREKDKPFEEQRTDSKKEMSLYEIARCMEVSPDEIIPEAIPTLDKQYEREGPGLQKLKGVVEKLSQIGEKNPGYVVEEYWNFKGKLDDTMKKMFDQYWNWSSRMDEPFREEKINDSKRVGEEGVHDNNRVDALVNRYNHIIDSERVLNRLLKSGSLSKSDGEVTDEDVESFGKEYDFPILFRQVAERIAELKEIKSFYILSNWPCKIRNSGNGYMIKKIGGVNYIPQRHIYEAINYIGKDLDEEELELGELLWENGPTPVRG